MVCVGLGVTHLFVAIGYKELGYFTLTTLYPPLASADFYPRVMLRTRIGVFSVAFQCLKVLVLAVGGGKKRKE